MSTDAIGREAWQDRIRATDVLGMDATHRTPIRPVRFGLWDFQEVREASFYGKPADSLFAVWTPPR